MENKDKMVWYNNAFIIMPCVMIFGIILASIRARSIITPSYDCILFSGINGIVLYIPVFIILFTSSYVSIKTKKNLFIISLILSIVFFTVAEYNIQKTIHEELIYSDLEINLKIKYVKFAYITSGKNAADLIHFSQIEMLCAFLSLTMLYLSFYKKEKNKESYINIINRGRTAEVFDLGNNKVLKLFNDNFPVKAINYEYKICMILNKLNLPVPKVYSKGMFKDRTGIVFEKINGGSMLQYMQKKPWRLIYYAKKFARLHSDIHKLKIDKILDQKKRIESFIKKTNDLSGDEKKVILKYLEKLEQKNILCHGDLHPDNILIEGNNFYIIDWMSAVKGSPEADIARTLIIMDFGTVPGKISLIFKILIFLFKKIFNRVYLKKVIKITGMDIKEINKWKLPLAAARLNEDCQPDEIKAIKKFIGKKLSGIKKTS